MAKRPGSKSSRSERKTGRQRVQRARERGLPEPRLVDRQAERARAPTREPGSGDGDDPSSDSLRARTSVKGPGIPTLVKVAVGAAAILLAVYVLSVLRDKPSSDTSLTPEPAGSEAQVEAQPDAPGAEPEHQPEPAPPAPVPAAPAPVAASAVPPAKPVVVSPAVAAPVKPQVVAPVAPAPAQPKPPSAPAPAAPAPAPAPAAPVVPAPAKAAPPPADNPY